MPTFTLSTTAAHLLNVAPGVSSADGIELSFTITGTNSGVLAINTAPPGAAVSLSNIAYLNGSLVAQSAGTAITSTGLVYVSAENASRGDLYLNLTATSGTVVVNVAPSSLGNPGSAPGGTIPAADVTAGTFGANTGETGDYTFPDDVVITDDLTVDAVTAGAITGTTGAFTGALSNTATSASLAQSTTTAQVNVGTGTGSGNSNLLVRGAAGTTRNLRVTTGASSARWDIGANSTAESGANAGSNLLISAYDDTGVAIDDPLTIVRAAGGAIYTPSGRPVAFGGAPGAAATVTRNRVATTAIADNVATTVATITVPNVAATATIVIVAQGSLGAGGAVGAREAMAQNSYTISVTRVAGVNAVASISSAYGATATNVAGAATCTAALTLGAVSGAVDATNTIPVQITIIKSGGASDNHTALTRWEVMNAATGGITVA